MPNTAAAAQKERPAQIQQTIVSFPFLMSARGLESEVLAQLQPSAHVPPAQEVMLYLLMVGAPIPRLVVVHPHRMPPIRLAHLMAMHPHSTSSVAGTVTQASAGPIPRKCQVCDEAAGC